MVDSGGMGLERVQLWEILLGGQHENSILRTVVGNHEAESTTTYTIYENIREKFSEG